jgi:hypothetical protein
VTIQCVGAVCAALGAFLTEAAPVAQQVAEPCLNVTQGANVPAVFPRHSLPL